MGVYTPTPHGGRCYPVALQRKGLYPLFLQTVTEPFSTNEGGTPPIPESRTKMKPESNGPASRRHGDLLRRDAGLPPKIDGRKKARKPHRYMGGGRRHSPRRELPTRRGRPAVNGLRSSAYRLFGKRYIRRLGPRWEFTLLSFCCHYAVFLHRSVLKRAICESVLSWETCTMGQYWPSRSLRL